MGVIGRFGGNIHTSSAWHVSEGQASVTRGQPCGSPVDK